MTPRQRPPRFGASALPTATRLVLGLALIAAIVPCEGCGPDRQAKEDESATPTVAVRVARVEERTFQPGVTAQGQWIAANELTVAAPFAALVDSVRVQPGDRVERGEVVAWLTTRESRAALDGAELLARQASDPAARAEAERAVALAQRDLVRVPVTVAAAGVVLRRSAGPGAMTGEGAELFAIVPRGAVVFEAHVPRTGAEALAVGRVGHVASQGGVPVEARVTRLLPNAGAADQSLLVWLAPTREPLTGILGRYGTVFIETGDPRRALGIPDSALVEDDLTGETRAARVESSGISIWTRVAVGAEQEGWRELRSNSLPPGATVVISGQHGLPDSTHVRVTP